MLHKSVIKQILLSSKPQLQAWGVSKLGLFGSAQRDTMNEESDIDILIDFEDDRETYNNCINTCDFLESAFQGRNLDIVH
ncbi:nucleotidyltransferase family protein [Dyadobacter arcticus]|uniref:Polymerase nucleotidyl transferase domain-containing protein n=1 Tax=Dyadobacter arcticus TaxID=1078754 RepID=A0ABX0URU9_9BACT|nr:hypothetical protein [Dyadobacter arcticus]